MPIRKYIPKRVGLVTDSITIEDSADLNNTDILSVNYTGDYMSSIDALDVTGDTTYTFDRNINDIEQKIIDIPNTDFFELEQCPDSLGDVSSAVYNSLGIKIYCKTAEYQSSTRSF